ncbi:hypothetical protein COOONC_12643 [Cooperia oncophora]
MTMPKAQTSVEGEQVLNEVSSIAIKTNQRAPSPSELNSIDYQEVLRIEEAVTCSSSDSSYNLTVVRNFLEELISRVQSSLSKTAVSWESVQKRFYDMMTGDDCPDLDLLSRYQLIMHFFQYSLDEKVCS